MLQILFWGGSGRVPPQYSGQGISVPRTAGLCIYQWSVPEKKQAEWLRKCPCKYSTEFLGLL